MDKVKPGSDFWARSKRLSTSNYAVLVTGESGVGKELVARAIHLRSQRADLPLIHVNCAALPESLAESELFGHTKGSFTGALGDRAGKFEVADGGTLFLDEIGELPLPIQAKLLRTLQEGEIQPVGSDRVKHVNVRIIAATNRNLGSEAEQGRSRLDLFHRLNVYPIDVKSLRERLDDLTVLLPFFVSQTCKSLGIEAAHTASDVMPRLKSYHWPGNVRELKNVLVRALLKAKSEQGLIVTLNATYFDLEGISVPVPTPRLEPSEMAPLRERVDAFQRQEILVAVEQSEHNWSEAARRLGMNRANLHHLSKRLGIK